MNNPSNKSHTPHKSRKEENDDLTEQVEETFPASDPPSMTQPGTSAGAPQGRKASDTGVEAELARQQAAKAHHRSKDHHEK